MAIREVFMPALSSTMTEGKIVSWQKSPGDKVEKGEIVVVVESDKADMDVETFYAGFIATIIVPAGESAPVGSAIALVAETEAEIETSGKNYSRSRSRTSRNHTECSSRLKYSTSNNPQKRSTCSIAARQKISQRI
jgi:pyruvate dehydrogenase E2 component (dihydrolipoamide acetyltransferase)